MIKYQEFYKNFGIRRADQLVKPPLPSVLRMKLPRLSLVHYLPTSQTEMGPNEDYFLFQKNSQPFRIDHVFWLEQTDGNPRRLPESPDIKIRDWRRDHQRFKVVSDLSNALRTPDAIVVANYSVLAHNYAYQNSLYREYYRAGNFVGTVIRRMDRYFGQGYNQFLEVRLPKVLPTLQMLDKAQVNPAPAIANLYSTFEMRFLLMMWRWLGPHRLKFQESAILSRVCSEINLIFREGDRFSCLNLEFLDKQRKATRAEVMAWEEAVKASLGATALEALTGRSNASESVVASYNTALEAMVVDKPVLAKPNNQGADPGAIQKRFLRILMGVMDARNPDVDERLDEVVADSSNAETDVPVDTAGTDGETADNGSSQKSLLPADGSIENPRAPLRNISSNTSVIELDEADQQRLELDLDTLAEMAMDQEKQDLEEGISPSTLASSQAISPEQELSASDLKALERDATSGMVNPGDVLGNFSRLLARESADGNLSANEYLALKTVSEKIEAIDIDGTTLNKYVQIDPEILKIKEQASIPDRDTIIDKSMLKSTLIDFQENYVTKVFKRDIASMVTNIMNAGYAIQDFQATPVSDIGGRRTEYAIRIKPIKGQPTTIRFTIPDVSPEGVWVVGNVAYRTRAQHGDIPIRVLSPTKVSLTSYFGKVSVERCDRRVADYNNWLQRMVRTIALNQKNDLITDVQIGKAFENSGEGVRDYTIIAQAFRSFNFLVDGNRFSCNFAASTIPERFSKESISWAKKNKSTLVGLANNGDALAADTHGQWYVVSVDGSTKPVGTIEELLRVDGSKAPVEFAELKVFAKKIPVGIVLGYMMGMRAVLAKLRIRPRVIPAGTRATIAADEFKVIFANETWVFDRKDPMARMIFGGLKEFDEVLARYNTDEFNRKDVYFNVLESKKLGMRYLKELDRMERLFVDPITRDLLIFYKEPTVFRELLIRSAELLTTDQHPPEVSGDHMRDKGYERFAGILYGKLVEAIRQHEGRPGMERFGLEMKNYAVMQAIMEDSAKDQVSEINPIQNMKEQEAIVFGGVGGRTSRTMVKHTRIFTKSDEGVISEQTVDSTDVAVTVSSTANPQYQNLRGVRGDFNLERDGVTALLSTSALVSPGSTRDDPKRVNFIGIQNRHVVPCAAYTQPALRTGYEQVIPYRVGPLFAVMAKKKGRVISANAEGIIVEYEDGKQVGVQLGRIFGNASGLTIPHTVVSPLVEGDVFEAGDPISYNTGFFEPDFLNPRQIIWKSSMLVRTVLLESPDTLEDSCAISASTSRRLTAQSAKIKDVIVNFDQVLHQLREVGDRIDAEDSLVIIEDGISARSEFLDAESIASLRAIQANSPEAKVKGIIERIEVFYNGDLEDMSESLRKLVKKTDKNQIRRLTSAGKEALTGLTPSDFRIGADPLMLDQACIRFFITSDVTAGVGDKGVFCNQMKTVIGRVFSDDITTESGLKIDAIFGARSVGDRIVPSPYIQSTTLTLQEKMGFRAVAAYRS